MMKQTILFLAANPLSTDRLALDQEARAIQVELERGGHRGRFELVTRWAVQPMDLLRELRRLRPTIVHFSGHGGRRGGLETSAGAGTVRDAVATEGELQAGLLFQGRDGEPQVVSTAALEKAFGAAGRSVKLVVLSACYSDAQATALAAHVDAVVGVASTIGDEAARAFAVGFYGGLADGESVAAAHQQGAAAICLEGIPDHVMPRLVARESVEVDRLVLAQRPTPGVRIAAQFRGRRLLAGLVLVVSGTSITMKVNLRKANADNAEPVTVHGIRPSRVDPGSSSCELPGWSSSYVAPHERSPDDVIDVRTSDSALDCDRPQTRQLLHPRIALHLSDQPDHQEIPPDLQSLANAVRLESERFLAHACAYALPTGPSDRIIGSVVQLSTTEFALSFPA